MRQGFLINVVIQGNFVNNKLPHIIIFESFTELSLDKLSGLHLLVAAVCEVPHNSRFRYSHSQRKNDTVKAAKLVAYQA